VALNKDSEKWRVNVPESGAGADKQA